LAVASIYDRIGKERSPHLAHTHQDGAAVVELERAAELVGLRAPHVLVAGLVNDHGVRPLEVVRVPDDHLARRADEGLVVETDKVDVPGIAVFQAGADGPRLKAAFPRHTRAPANPNP